MGEYYIIMSDAGVALEASAHAAGEPVVLTAFGVCDGGAAFTPDPAQTTLANEVYRGDISSLSVSADDTSVLEAQCIIPASSGGYTIRGIGLYAGDTLYAVGNYPDQPKPAPDSGYAASLEILAQLAVSDTADVTLNVTDGAWLTRAEGDQLYAPLTRKVNGHALMADVNVTAQDIFSGQAVGIGDAADLNSYTTPGLYYQPANAQAATGKNYPEANAGSLEVYKHAGITQIYRIYSSSRSYIRTLYNGTWSAWTKQYDAANKPSPADIGAVNKGGDTMSGTLKVGAEVQSANANSFRIAYGDYGTFWRNDGSNLYLMLTNKGDAYGAYNALRPLRVSLETGALQSETPLTVGNTVYASKEITAGYSGAFAWVEQYKTKAPFFNSYSTTGSSEYHPVIKQQATITGKNSWAFSMGSLVASDALSWHLHMKGSGTQEINYKWDTNGNFSAPGQIVPGSYANFDNRYYTKSQSDNGYMAKTGAYTKAESDARYVQNVRVGAAGTFKINKDVWSEAPVGAFMTGWYYEGDNPGGDSVHYRPLQINVNGSWRTITT
ncbi:phage tail protein [Enterobacter kobei]|nr:phage tail protein [Enterobacter kobei]